MEGGNKIIFNSSILFVKMFFTIGISLYTTRILLNNLGVEDFGIYNLIAGVISMLGFINVTLAITTQRFLSFSLGLKDRSESKVILSNSFFLHFIIAIIMLIIFETIGLYLLNNKLLIPNGRLDVANTLFQFVIFSTLITILAAPFDGLISAHEDMFFLAIIEFLESSVRLLIAIYLIYSEEDKLLVYGGLLLISTFLFRTFKYTYCRMKYPESKVNYFRNIKKSKIKELTSFSFWNLFGVLSYFFRSQGIAVVLNVFYGVVVNSAFAIANQISNQLSVFSQTLVRAIKPQIVRSEGAGERERMLKLALLSSKFSFFLMSMFAIPIFLELNLILKLWLKDVPEFTLVFCRIIIIYMLLQQLTNGVVDGVQAIGKIKIFQIVTSILRLIVLPIGYYILKFGYPNYSILLLSLGIEFIASFFRIFYFSIITGLKIKDYFNAVIFLSLLPFFMTLIPVSFVHGYMEESLFRILAVVIVTLGIYGSTIYFFGLNSDERIKITNMKKDFFLLLKVKF